MHNFNFSEVIAIKEIKYRKKITIISAFPLLIQELFPPDPFLAIE